MHTSNADPTLTSPWNRTQRRSLFRRRSVLVAFAASSCVGLTAVGCGTSADGVDAVAQEDVASAVSALTTAEKQTLANAFYSWANPITVNFDFDDAKDANGDTEWDRLRKEPSTAEYTWHRANSVTITSPKKSFTMYDVGVKKKSVKGSFSTVKPSVNVDYARYPEGTDDASKKARDAKEKQVESYIGINRVMFNNGIQDHNNSRGETPKEEEYVYIRQCLGYKLLQKAGLPYQRCNFVNVQVEGKTVGTYINVEPVEKRYAQNNYAGNSAGNMYELNYSNWYSDFVTGATAGKTGDIELKGFSDYEDGKDIMAAIGALNVSQPVYSQFMDVQQFIKVWAMEILLKHWDGYSLRHNNTYVYNDVTAVPSPTVIGGNVRLKFAMSGIDQILQYNGDHKEWELYWGSALTTSLMSDTRTDYEALLRRQAYALFNGLFSPWALNGSVIPDVRTLESAANYLLAQAGKPLVPAGAADMIINTQLKGMRRGIDKAFDAMETTWTADLIAGARQKNGILDAFHLETNGAIRHNTQVQLNGAWNTEVSLGGYAKQLVVARNDDRRLEVFYIGTNDLIYHNWQTTPNGAWSGEVALGGSAKQLAVGQNDDGRLELFYVGTNGLIYHNWQGSPNGGWAGETALGGAAKQLTVAKNQDGSLEVIYINPNDGDKLYHNWQGGSNGWAGATSLGGIAKQVVVGKNADGRLEAFYVGAGDALFHNYQLEPNGAWSGPLPFDGYAKQIAVASNEDGRLELFYVGTNDRIYHNYQGTPNSGWAGESALGGLAKRLSVVRNTDGRLDVIYVGTNDVMYHNVQVAPNTGWVGESAL